MYKINEGEIIMNINDIINSTYENLKTLGLHFDTIDIREEIENLFGIRVNLVDICVSLSSYDGFIGY